MLASLGVGASSTRLDKLGDMEACGVRSCRWRFGGVWSPSSHRPDASPLKSVITPAWLQMCEEWFVFHPKPTRCARAGRQVWSGEVDQEVHKYRHLWASFGDDAVYKQGVAPARLARAEHAASLDGAGRQKLDPGRHQCRWVRPCPYEPRFERGRMLRAA